MKIAALPDDEEIRLLDLYSYELLDSFNEKEYDDLVRLAGQICNCPISSITFIDKERQWFKASIGLEDSETSRDVAFCAHTILSEQPLVVENATEDERFFDNPLVTEGLKIRFYAGAPIVSPSGHQIGSVCVIDQKPGKISEEQLSALSVISSQITKLIELRAKNILLRKRATSLLKAGNDTLIDILKTRDDSENSIVYELHEQIAQKLAACHLHMEMKSPLAKDLLGEALVDLRTLSNSISPSSLKSMPLDDLLVDLISKMRLQYPFPITLQLNGVSEEHHQDNTLTCLRIVDQWVNELPATTSKVEINCKLNGKINLEIKDYGNISAPMDIEERIIKSTVYSRIQLAGGELNYSCREKLNLLSLVL